MQPERRTASMLLAFSPFSTVGTSLACFFAFLAIGDEGGSLGFFSGTASSLVAETLRDDRRGSSAGRPSARSLAFRLGMLLDSTAYVSYEYLVVGVELEVRSRGSRDVTR